MRNKRFYRVLLALVVISLLAAACRPAPPAPPVSTEEPGAKTPSLAQPTSALTDFTMIDDGSPIPPRVISRHPSGGDELAPGEAIELTFDQAMDIEKTGSAFQLLDGEGKETPGEISWEGDRTLRFLPSQGLQGGALYFASLETQAASAAGVAVLEPYGFQFLAAADLQVSQVFPADGARNVASDAVITVIFNRPVAPLTIAEERQDLPNPLIISPSVEGKGEWVNTSVYAFRPEPGLKGGTEYQVLVRAGLKDAAGQSTLAGDYTWSFSTTRPGIEWFALSDGRTNPENNAENVLLDEYFSIRFQQPMHRSSTEQALSIVDQSGEKASLITEWQDDDYLLVITPTQRLKLDTAYTLRLDTSAQAATGGELTEGLDWSFHTIPPPVILSTRPADGRTQTQYTPDLYIKFASPMRIDTVKPRIVISPRPEKEVQWYYNEWDWSLVGFFLQPSTNYEIRFQAGMEDIYGNPTRQEQVIHFTTAPYSPSASLLMPYDAPMLRAGITQGQEIYIVYTNVSSVTLTLHRLSSEQFISLLSGRVNAYNYRPSDASRIWQAQEQGSAKLNERVVKKYLPFETEGQPISPGFYFLALDSPDIRHDGPFVDYRLLYVASANLTFKTSTTDGLLWLTDLDSGQPLADQPAKIWDDRGVLIGEGRTDSDGKLHLDLPAPSDEGYAARFALVDNGEVFGFASSQWGSGVNTYDYGIWMDYYAPANRPTAYVYTERPIYRPGQPVYFKGIVRLDTDLEYSIPDVRQVTVKISSFEETVYEEELPLSSFGSFDGKFVLDAEAALGYYSLEVYLAGRKDPIGNVTFNVAEYRKPEFQIKVEASPADVLSGESFTASVQADYYSGGGVANAVVAWTLIAETYYFQPPDEYASYSFTDFEQDVWGYREGEGPRTEKIAEGQGRTDAAGRFTVTLPVDLSAVAEARNLIFEATVTDLAQTSVSGRTNVVAHLSQVYPGIRSATYVGKQGKEQTFEMVLLDWDGNPLPNRLLSLEIVERRWYSVQEQDPSGRITWKTSVEEIPVERFDELTTDENGEAEATFIPPRGGVYRGRVTALDDRGNPGRASAFMWVAGEDYIPWQQTNDRGFELITDKKSYQPGEAAQVLIASPFQGETYALVTVERGRIRYQDVVLLTNNSTIYELPITPDLAPNAYISVVVVKGIDETNPRPNFKLGIAQIEVDANQQTIQVEVVADREIAAPGEQVQYIVRTRDYQGKPLRAEVSLSLSDLATLSLLPPNSIPILDHFYSKRSLSVWTAVPMVNNLEEYNLEIEEEVQLGAGGGSGGGKGEGELGVIDVRQDFPDTAFWEAHVLTNERGEAAVVVTLPDNLTTWRMDARAITQDTRVGQTTYDLVSTRPLLVRPQTPRFFIANDQAILGAAVHNNTDEALNVEVALEAEGLMLNSPALQKVSVPAGQQAYVTWETQVTPGAQRVDLVFRAQSGDLQDASRPPQGTLDNQGLPVYHFAAPETVGTSGQMTAGGARVEGIFLPQTMKAYDGELTVQISPSLAASMTDGLTYLETYPYACVEQTISSFLPNVLTTQALKVARLSNAELEADLKEHVWKALQRIYNWQNSDGGWGWWRNDKSDPLTSAYVTLGLIEANQAGYTVNESVIERGLNYLRLQVEPLVGLKDPYKVNRQAFILYVLARGGKPDVSSAVQLFDQRQRMAVYSQAFLAQTLWLMDPSDERIKTLLADFNSQAILSATGSHWEEKQVDRWNWNTDTRTTAIVLSALSQIDPQNPLNANAVRWLMSSRTGGHWQGTQETAWTLMALTHWMEASGELKANYQYAVALNGKELGSGTANQETLRQTQILKVDIKEMLEDQLNRLAFARSDGAGNLYYTAHLNVSLPVEKTEALDQGIIVSRSYYRLNDPKTPVVEARQGELLLVRLTIVAPYTLHHVMVEDPLPAGLESVDQSLSTSPQSVEVPRAYSFNDVVWRGWGWWFFNHIEYRDEKVVLSASYLPAGTYVYTYLARAGTIGVFHVIPITAYEFYFPEVYGRSQGGLFTVTP